MGLDGAGKEAPGKTKERNSDSPIHLGRPLGKCLLSKREGTCPAAPAQVQALGFPCHSGGMWASLAFNFHICKVVLATAHHQRPCISSQAQIQFSKCPMRQCRFSEVSAFRSSQINLIRCVIKEVHILRAKKNRKKQSPSQLPSFFHKRKLASPGFCNPSTHRLFIITPIPLLCDLKLVDTLFLRKL